MGPSCLQVLPLSPAKYLDVVTVFSQSLKHTRTNTLSSLICPDLIAACLTQTQTCEAAAHRNVFISVSTKNNMFLNDLPPAGI